MTMNKIIAKLRKNNQEKYRILGVCIFLSILLVTAFTMMYFSSSVQEMLPPGGDTRKLAGLLLGVTVIGCIIFTVYGANLFYKYKSREFGVMLALGEQKKRLGRWLAAELSAVILKYTALGLLLSIPASFLIWKLFSAIVITTSSLRYSFSPVGLAAGALFALVLAFFVLFAGRRFIRRANIMDILNDQRKTELVREISPKTGKIGIALIVTGLFLAMAVPPIVTKLFLFLMPSVWNLTYLLSIAGLYLFMLSAVGNQKKGRHPEKYYKNIISTNLMRFTARQTTKNMCVITLLVFVFLIAVFWGAMYFNSAYSGSDTAPYDFSLHYPATERQLTEEDTFALAEKHQVTITRYEEADTLQPIVRYTARDLNDNGNYFDVTYEKLAAFMSASDFSRISGTPAEIENGSYKTVTSTNYKQGVWVGPDCLQEIISPAGDITMQPAYAGTLGFDGMIEEDMSRPFTFVISDEDFQYLAAGLGPENKEHLVFFNTKDPLENLDFAKEWQTQYILHASEPSARIGNYDAHEEALSLAQGKDYGYSYRPELSPDNTSLMGDWKYKPFSKIISKADATQMIAVFILLSFYIAVISLASVGIMTYVRSVTIAIDNRQLFIDLKKLGANEAYELRVLKQQLRKIFAYPALAGSALVLLFALFLTVFNDMRLQPFEVKMLLMECAMIILNALYFYIVYRLSLRKTERIILSED